MKNISALLNNPNNVLFTRQPHLKSQLKKIKNVASYEDILAVNGKEKTKDRLRQLAINPNDNIELERIIGKNCLMDVSFFSKGLEVARTVCRIIEFDGQNKLPHGTGFLVGNGLLMTNNHVIETKNIGNRLFAEFEYEKDTLGLLKTSYFFRLDPEVFFMTNNNLDYTVIGVEPIASNDNSRMLTFYGANKLALSKNRILEGEAVSIVQHPKGLPKMIAIRENKVVKIKEPHIHYTTDTQPGSSGALVVNDQWEIIALHRAGVPERDSDNRIKLTKGGVYNDEDDWPFVNWIANQGVLMDTILKDISSKNVKNQKQQEKKEELLINYQSTLNEAEYRLPI